MTQIQEIFLVALAKAREPKVKWLFGYRDSKRVCTICGSYVYTRGTRREMWPDHFIEHTDIFKNFEAWAIEEQVRIDEELQARPTKAIARRAVVVARGLAIAATLQERPLCVTRKITR